MTAVFIVLGVLAALLVLLFAVCGVIFKQLVWQKSLSHTEVVCKIYSGRGRAGQLRARYGNRPQGARRAPDRNRVAACAGRRETLTLR